MRIYVAGKFEETTAVRAAQQRLRELGHEISHDWTGESAAGLDGAEREAYLKTCAEADYQGVLTADALLVLNHPNGCGLFAEVGMGLAFGKPIYVANLSARDCIFFRMDGVQAFESVNEAIAALQGDAEHLGA